MLKDVEALLPKSIRLIRRQIEAPVIQGGDNGTSAMSSGLDPFRFVCSPYRAGRAAGRHS